MRGESLERATAGRVEDRAGADGAGHGGAVRCVVLDGGARRRCVAGVPLLQHPHGHALLHDLAVGARQRRRQLPVVRLRRRGVSTGTPASSAARRPIYRFYNTSTGTHFYTQSEIGEGLRHRDVPGLHLRRPGVLRAARRRPSGQHGALPLLQHEDRRALLHDQRRRARPRDRRHGRGSPTRAVAYYVYTSPTPSAAASDTTNAAPKATLAASATSVNVPGDVTLTATATDADGTIAKVQFYAGSSMIGESTTAPYTSQLPIARARHIQLPRASRSTTRAPRGARTPCRSRPRQAAAGPRATSRPKITLASSATSIRRAGLGDAHGDRVATPTARSRTSSSTTARASSRPSTAPPYTYTYNTSVAGTCDVHGRRARTTSAPRPRRTRSPSRRPAAPAAAARRCRR